VKTEALAVRARWQRSHLAETVASDRVSAACYRNTENVEVVAVFIPELKFRDGQRQYLRLTTSYQRRTREPINAPMTVMVPMLSPYQVSTNSGESSGQCAA
jgi:hypothetical protein